MATSFMKRDFTKASQPGIKPNFAQPACQRGRDDNVRSNYQIR